MKWNLLYFDDQIQNIEAFSDFLDDKFNVVGCSDVRSFPKMLEENNPHALLLDVHMPVLDGHELYKKITEHPLYNGCPVLFISGDESDENKIKSLTGGGIDFIPRSVDTEEISLRLLNKINFFLKMSTLLSLGNLTIDARLMIGKINDTIIDLTLLELRMLSHILRAYPSFLSRSELINKIWGDDSVKPGTINTHLTNLKPKIESWDYQIKIRDDFVQAVKK